MLNELGQKISNALAMVNNAETIDEKARSDARSTLQITSVNYCSCQTCCR